MEDFLNVYRSKRILVTGGIGFIGSNLVHALSSLPVKKITVVDSLEKSMGGNKKNIIGIKNDSIIKISDIANSEKLGPIVREQDFIFNLAGNVSHIDSMAYPDLDTSSNYTSHLAFLETCRKFNPRVRIIYSSTRQVYGRTRNVPVGESHPTDPVDLNGINKLACEKIHLLYFTLYGIPVSILRLTNTYGPRQLMKHFRQGFISCFIKKAIDGEEIEVFGDGSQLRGLNHIDDVIRALLMVGATNDTIGEVYNLGAKESYSLEYIAHLLTQLTGRGRYKKVPFPPERHAIDIGSYLGDYSKIEKTVGWEPKIPIIDGLRSTIQFYQEYKDWYWS